MKLYDLLRTITHDNYTVYLQDINFFNEERILYNPLNNKKEILKIKEDENSGVKWVPIEDVKKVSTEKWIVENVYEKLNEKLKSQLKFVLN